MIKKSFFLLFALLSLVAKAQTEVEIDELKYSLSEDGTAVVKGVVAASIDEVSIPSTIEYNSDIYRVTTIGDFAFYWRDDITSIIMPETVTTIKQYSIAHCTNLTDITIPKSVTTIEWGVFSECASLERMYCYVRVPLQALSYPSGSNITIYVPDVSVEAYKAAGGWKDCTILPMSQRPNAATINGIKYLLLSDETATVCGVVDKTADNVVIPQRVECNSTIYNVTSIGNKVFYNCSSLVSVTIPEGVTTIGEYAFSQCSSLASVTIPEGVTTIGEHAFSQCSSLTDITLPESVESIGECAFYDCPNLTSITIPEGVTFIGSWAFQYCTDLETVYCYMPNPSTYDRTFPYGAIIYVPDASQNAFKAADGWKDHTIYPMSRRPLSVTIDGVKYRLGYNGSARVDGVVNEEANDVVIPQSVEYNSKQYTITSINKKAFYQLSLTSIVIPENVKSIGEYAFFNCNNLTSITIPEKVTVIGNRAFSSCYGLKAVYCYASYPRAYNYIFYGYDMNSNFVVMPVTIYVLDASVDAYKAADGWKEHTILPMSQRPYEVTVDGVKYKLLSDGTAIVEAVTDRETNNVVIRQKIEYNSMEYDVKAIGNEAFYNCSKLTSVSIPEGVTTIGKFAFSSCSSLTSITLPESVTTIGEFAFSNCSGPTSITLPGSITFIGENAFYGCSNLDVVCCNMQTPSDCNNAFPNGVTIYVPDASVDAYKAASGWKEHTILPISERPYEVTKDGVLYRLLSDGTALVYAVVDEGVNNIVIPKNIEYNSRAYNVTAINNKAFSNCSSLAGVTIPESVKSIGEGAFSYCSNLTKITIPEGVTTISDSAFYCCSNLASITIPQSVTTIGNYSFYCCSSLANMTMPESLTSIGNYSFYNCSSLVDITIPKSVTAIGFFSFYNCTNLKTVYCYVSSPLQYSNLFRDQSGACLPITIYVPGTSEYAYKVADGWKEHDIKAISSATEVVVDGVKYILLEDGAAKVSGVVNTGVDAVTIQSEIKYNSRTYAVTTIGDYAFSRCYSLKNVTMPQSITSIGSYAFYNSYSLANVTIPKSVKAIGNYAFYFSNIASITIPEGVTSIGEGTFDCCFKLASITIPESVTTIGTRAFSGCSSLSAIAIPDGVTIIGESAFSGCSSLTGITLPKSLTAIGHSAFNGCSSLTSITIPESVKTIGASAFSCCSNLDAVYCYVRTPLSYSKIFYGYSLLSGENLAVNI